MAALLAGKHVGFDRRVPDESVRDFVDNLHANVILKQGGYEGLSVGFFGMNISINFEE